MKNSVPFLDEEFLAREKKAKNATSVARNSAARAQKTSASNTGSATVARVNWYPAQNGHCLKINISGTLDIRCMKQWRRLLKDCQRLNSQRFELDLKETGDFGLAALALLLMLKDSRQVRASDFVLNQCSQELLRLLHWTGLNSAFTVRAVKARNG